MSNALPYRVQDYRTVELLGEGVHGKVLHCFKPDLPEAVAVKIMKAADEYTYWAELRMLQHVRALPPEFNVVSFIDSFVWGTDKCMVFEMLDMSLYDMLVRRRTLQLHEIRLIAKQLLVAFDGLQQLGVVHTDLKLDNVMLVNQKRQPWRVKLIDFGLAMPKSELRLGMEIQPDALEAPEVTLGLPLTEAVDMWALGCLLVTLYLGVHPFAYTPYERQRTIMEVLGCIPDDLLCQGINTPQYYTQREDGQWRFMTPYEFQTLPGLEALNGPGPLRGDSLDTAILSWPHTRENPEFEDRLNFLSFCKSLLNVDYRKRMTPREAHYHPFLTLWSLRDDHSHYANMARAMKTMIKDIPIGTNNPGEYMTLQVLGNGMFQCFKANTSDIAAIKMKLWDDKDFRKQVGMLQHVGQLDPDRYNIVKFIDSSVQDNQKYMAFEMLDMTLNDILVKRHTLKLHEIRPIAQQLLVAFDGLKELGVVHTNLTLDNVMLVNQKLQPWKVKLIDFARAMTKSELRQGKMVQPKAYRAPEVTLGLPLTEAIDMWSLGCLLANLYLGVHPFSPTPYENQCTITEALGFPPDDVLSEGIYTNMFYTQNDEGQWRLKTPEEILEKYGEPVNTPAPLRGLDLDRAILSSPNTLQYSELRDRLTFLSFLECLLNLDHRKRLTPGGALYHPFITMKYLEDDQSDYANMARDVMAMFDINHGPQEPSAEETPQNQSDPLEESRQEEEQSKAGHIQQEEQEHVCDAGDLVIKDQIAEKDSIRSTQQKSNTNREFVAIAMDGDCVNVRQDKELSKAENPQQDTCDTEVDNQTDTTEGPGRSEEVPAPESDLNSPDRTQGMYDHVRDGLWSVAN